MKCRAGCGACCIAISISTPLPGMPEGKEAGLRCSHLNSGNRCLLHDTPDYPPVCRALTPHKEMCGTSFEEAYAYLENLEQLTTPT